MDSSCIGDKIASLLKRINRKDEILVFGYVRSQKYNVPSSIINYIIVYAFLDWWFKHSKNIQVQYDIAVAKSGFLTCIYGNQLIEPYGVHEFKVKLHAFNSQLIVGIASNVKHLDTFYFFSSDTFHYCYSTNGYKTSHTLQTWMPYPDENSHDNRVKALSGDIITVHVDFKKQIVAFYKNDTFIANAFNDIERKPYRLAICMPGNSKVEFLSYT
eukprot:352774_1